MSAGFAERARAAIEALDAALAAGATVDHRRIRRATIGVTALRDCAIAEVRSGRLDASVRDKANALVSLAYGAEFPISGLHLRRLKQARDGVAELIGASPG